MAIAGLVTQADGRARLRPCSVNERSFSDKSNPHKVRYYSAVLPLTSRLGLVAAQISEDAKALIDIGYDHGHLLTHLAVTRPDLVLIGGEVLPDARARFEEAYGTGIADLRLGDGLAVVEPGEVDVAVFCGLTDRTIIRLLTEGKAHLPYLKQIICCPPALECHLRPGLSELGHVITEETIAFKRHRSYDIITSEPGEVTDPPHPWGPVLVRRQDPLLIRHLEIQKKLMAGDLSQGLKSHRQADGTLDRMGQKLALLETLLSEAQGWTG